MGDSYEFESHSFWIGGLLFTFGHSFSHEAITIKQFAKMPTVHLLDYVAGNVRSLVNAIEKVGYEVAWVKTPEEVKNADVCNTAPAPKTYN